MKKLLTANFAVLCLIALNVLSVCADSGQPELNIPFIVIVSLLAPVLVGVIVYYALSAKKLRNSDKDKDIIKIVRDYDDK